MFACPCCSYLTLSENPPGTHEICEVCGWEDDLVQFNASQRTGGANSISLDEARKNYKTFGYGFPDRVSEGRRPRTEEYPKPSAV